MKKLFKIVLTVVWITTSIASSAQTVEKTDNRLIGYLNLTYCLGYDSKLNMVKVLISKSDTTVMQGNTSINTNDFTAWMPKKEFERLQRLNKPFFVHARWQEFKKGQWVDIEKPTDLNKVKKNQYCLVFNWGLVQPWPTDPVIKPQTAPIPATDGTQKKTVL